MQYSVPQFVEIEDKIIAFLTLKQFLILLGGGLVTFLLWSIFGASIIFFLLTLPTIGFFALLAFGKFNGRPLLANAPHLVNFFLKPRVRIFHRSSDAKILSIVKKQPARLPAPEGLTADGGQVSSRLKRLAYLLDQKTAEEERLIHSGKMPQRWLNQI